MSFINKMNIGNVSYDIQAGEKVQLTFPAGTTNGTLTEEQLAKLQANYQSCIKMVNDKELYYLNDPGHIEGYLTYSHVGIENSKATIKTLTITVSAKSFVIVTTVVPTESGGGGKLYRHQLQWSGDNGSIAFEILISQQAPITSNTLPKFLYDLQDHSISATFYCVSYFEGDVPSNIYVNTALRVEPTGLGEAKVGYLTVHYINKSTNVPGTFALTNMEYSGDVVAEF